MVRTDKIFGDPEQLRSSEKRTRGRVRGRKFECKGRRVGMGRVGEVEGEAGYC